MREFLIELDRELEARRRALGPAARDLGARLPVERRVHLDRVEVLGVEAQLVEAPVPARLRARRIEEAVPGARAPSGSSTPTCRCEGSRHAVGSGSPIQTSDRRCLIDNARMLTVNEIFYSIQGESTRRAAVRVRPSDRLRPALLLVRYAVRLPRRAARRSLDDVSRRSSGTTVRSSRSPAASRCCRTTCIR